MDYTFFLVIAAILTAIFLSALLVFRPKNLAGKIEEMVGGNRVLIARCLRITGVFFIILCLICSFLILQHTHYGKTLQGQHYFSRFLKTKSREDANRAFAFWQQAGKQEAFAEAEDKIPQDSPLWHDFIVQSARLYYDRNKPELYFQYLHRLETKLDHPVAKSAINFELGNAYQNIDPARAEKYFNTVLNLGSDKELTDRARGNIYEIHNLNIGDKVPDFELTTISGKTIGSADLRGRVVLLEFWSMHCGGCIKEIPQLRRIYEKTKGKDVLLLGISLDSGGDVIRFIEQNEMAWEQVMVDRKTSTSILHRFNIQFIPSSYIIDKNGKIAFKKLRGDKLEEAILQLL